MSLPTIDVVDNFLSLQAVVTEIGENNGPYQPIHTACENNAKTNYAMKPVRKCLVNAVAIARRDKRSHDEIDVTETEEDCHWQRRLDWWVPIPFLPVKVEVNKGASNEHVYDG